MPGACGLLQTLLSHLEAQSSVSRDLGVGLEARRRESSPAAASPKATPKPRSSEILKP